MYSFAATSKIDSAAYVPVTNSGTDASEDRPAHLIATSRKVVNSRSQALLLYHAYSLLSDSCRLS